MIYEYSCPDCGTHQELMQNMSEPHELVTCLSCGGVAKRVWTAPQSITDNKPAYFDNGLGCVVRSRSDIREAIKRINGKTGQNIVECDKPYKSTPKLEKYPTAREMGIS